MTPNNTRRAVYNRYEIEEHFHEFFEKRCGESGFDVELSSQGADRYKYVGVRLLGGGRRTFRSWKFTRRQPTNRGFIEVLTTIHEDDSAAQLARRRLPPTNTTRRSVKVMAVIVACCCYPHLFKKLLGVMARLFRTLPQYIVKMLSMLQSFLRLALK